MAHRKRSPSSTGTPSGSDIPPHARGGQELPDDVQDRPEQNAGYDEAVRSGPSGETHDDLGVEPFPGEGRTDISIVNPGDDAARGLANIDERAERSAIAEVRRRERRR